MDKQYNHATHEGEIYALWEQGGAFSPNEDPDAKPFTILMPPPNANDPLHVGHAMFVTIEDILIRYHRMKGDAALWIPGTDHAGIETQFVFEKKLAKQGKSRFNYDRDTLYSMIWDYVQENSDVAVKQLKRIGASADWSRFRFMLDDQMVAIVLKTFEELHNDGLVYRSERLVNYCTKCGTAFSELEVDRQERTSPFFTIQYGPFTIGTVRPETKFRDTALAVHPNDKRYKDYIGQTFEIQGLLGPITMKVIADPEVDPEFGTGIMKVTPAHDPHDFELGQQYDLPVTPIIGFDGRMDFSWYLNDPTHTDPTYRARAEKYHGLKVAKMREVMKEDLEADGLLVDYNPNYQHSVGVCYRCGTPIEPLPMPQFFIKVKRLTERVLSALEQNEVVVYGAGHDKILKHWLKNLRDWNISRQIVWGIRMPVWYDYRDNPQLRVSFVESSGVLVSGEIGDLLQRNPESPAHRAFPAGLPDDKKELTDKSFSIEEIKEGLQTVSAPAAATYVVSVESPGDFYLQETDTFDTWFSSAQWPYTTLLTNKAGDFERFYPTQVMETGYDILPFWVMRMLIMGYYKTAKMWGVGKERPPFENVYLHGLVRDEKGQKMSKSKGNVINPLDVIEKFGADALRMALVMSTTAGKDSNTGETKIRGMRNFTNKIWNAARYSILSYQDSTQLTGEHDEQFYETLNVVIKDIEEHLDALRVGLAAEVVYNQFWHWYCDVVIEEGKQGLIGKQALLDGLVAFLKLLHPFVPFVTEAVYQVLREQNIIDSPTLLVTTNWPGRFKK